jgi:predicted Zn-dependent protease
MPRPAEGRGQGEGPGHRPQVLALSPEEELQVGRKAYREVLQEVRGRILPRDSEEYRRADQVVQKIAKAATIGPLQREINLNVRGYHFEWEVNVVRDKQVNAFCLPAGKMIVFTGILKIVENDDQLAAVLGHEMAHALAHHGSERIAREQRQGKNVLAMLASRSYDRMQESEADHIGLFLMTFAGYSPIQAVRFWERTKQAEGHGGLPEFLSDHPGTEHRIRDLERWARQAAAGKKAFDEGRIAPAPGR